MTETTAVTARPLAEAVESERVRMVVFSDIHATQSGDPTTNVARSTVGDTKANALSAARELVVDRVGEADVLLCPGDLVHEGKTEPMGWVWEQLHATADALSAELVGAVGNHDLLLEPTGGQNAEDALRALAPEFPHPNQECVMSYWGHDFAVVETDRWRVASLNSCSGHGGFDRAEARHGRLKDFCLKKLGEHLEQLGPGPAVNVCAVHHQPQEWTHRGDKDANHMFEGDLLIEFLDQRPERWLLVNGHKHHPALGYVGFGSSGPVWLAAGSIGADLLGDSGVAVRNQLHIVDFHVDAQALGLTLAGEVRCFDWEPGYGWTAPGPRSGLPARAAFGYRRDGIELAVWLSDIACARRQRRWTWDDIVDLEPRCAYLTPRDREEFFEGVRRVGGGVQAAPDHEDFLEVAFTW